MNSKFQHLRLTKPHLFTHVASTKSVVPNQLRLRAPGFKDFRRKPLRSCSGFKVKRHDFSLLFSSFSFSFIFLLFWKTRWPSTLGNHNLLWVVNETRVGLHDKGVMQFLRLLQKTDVHGVWLAKGGKKRSNIRGLQLTNHLIMHGTTLVSMSLGSVSISQLKGKAKPQKKKKMGVKILQMS